MEGDTQVPVVVTEESVTPKAARPSVIDHSRYEITEARVGDLSARVSPRPLGNGGNIYWCCEISWRGQYLWSDIVFDPERSKIEEMAARLIRGLTYVVAVVGGDKREIMAATAMPVTIALTWVALPEESAE